MKAAKSWALRTVCLTVVCPLLVVPAGVVLGQGVEDPKQAPPQVSDAELARFERAADYSSRHAGRAVLIQRGGQVVYERYDNGGSANTPQPLASGTKSFTGVAAMFAVQDGLLTLDEKVSDTITQWKDDPKKAQITVRHLLTLSSGLQPDAEGTKERNRDLGAGRRGLGEAALAGLRQDWFAGAVSAPMTGTAGGQFAYGGNHFYAFGELLERKLAASKVPQKQVWDYYQARIFEPIGLTVARIGRDRQGHPNLPGGCSLTAREWVKFGQFVLNQGAWTGAKGEKVQLLKPELLAQCFAPSERNPSYGLTWWLRRSGDEATNPRPDRPARGSGGNLREQLEREHFDRQLAPIAAPDGKPVEVHIAAGLGGQKLYVLPQFDVVVVRFATIGNTAGRGFDDKTFLGHVLNLAPARGDARPAGDTTMEP